MFKVYIKLYKYLFNDFILCKTISYLKLNFKLKKDPKMDTFKNLKKVLKTWKKIAKNIWQPCIKQNINRSLTKDIESIFIKGKHVLNY